MKIFLTGGSGFVGRVMVRELLSQNHVVKVAARDPKRTGSLCEPAKDRVEILAWDAVREPLPSGALDDVDAVINLLGIISECRDQTFDAVHVGATNKLLQAAHGRPHIRFLQMSALGTRPQADSRYHQTKWEAEELVRQSALGATIFRPSVIFGDQDHVTTLFLKIARFSPVLPLIGSGSSKLQPVHVRDVASCFVKALTLECAIGRTYDLCGDEVLSFREYIQSILASRGLKRGFLPIPIPIAKIQAAFLEQIHPRLFRSAPPLNRDQIIMIQEDSVGDNRNAKRDLDWKPKSFKEWLSENRR